MRKVILVILVLVLNGCTLHTVKYYAGGGFGRDESQHSATYTDHERYFSGKHWGLHGGVELIFKVHGDGEKRKERREKEL